MAVITLIKLTDILKQINEEPQQNFNRVKYYEKYYKNLSPSEFKVQSKDNNIIKKKIPYIYISKKEYICQQNLNNNKSLWVWFML